MSAGMDPRLSADSEIKRLQEMVKRLESRNAQLKSGEATRPRTANSMERIRDENSLDDVPLMDFKEDESDNEDTWLYVSPTHAPSPAQKAISPYEYLQRSVEAGEVNTARCSLLAKLESIASQGSLQHQSESNGPRPRKDKPKEESVDRPEGGNLREPSFEELEEELEELQQLTVRLDYDSPVRRRGAKQIVPQTTTYQENSGTYTRRRGPQSALPDTAWADGSGEDVSPVQPQSHRGPLANMDQNEFSDEEKQRTFVRRRAPPPDVGGMDKAEVNSQTFVRRRGQADNHRAVVNVPDGDEEGDVESAPMRKRGSNLAAPQPRGIPAPPQAAWAGEDDEDASPVQLRRRGPVEDGELNGPVARRRPSPRSSIARYPVKTEAASSLEDDHSSTQAPAARSGQAIPIVTAVRRRQPAAEGGVQLRRSMSPQQHSGTPSRRGSAVPRSLKPEETDVRRRSLPQVPSHVSKSENFGVKPSGTRTPPRRRVLAPNEAGPTPRGSKLLAPRVFTPRGASPQPDDNSSWRDGCF